MYRCVFALVVTMSPAGSAVAQERPAAEQQTLVDLAYALGESHALRQVCAGDGDQYWRDRMMRLSDTEAGDEAFSSRLTQAFNGGFAQRRNQFQGCGDASRRAEQAVARKGQSLARRLSSVTRVIGYTTATEEPSENIDPDSVAQTPPPH